MRPKCLVDLYTEVAKCVWDLMCGVLHRFQHCTGHITMGSWKGRGNQYIEFVRVLYCKLPTNGKQLPAFPLEALPGIEPRPQRWEARVLPLCHRGPFSNFKFTSLTDISITPFFYNAPNLLNDFHVDVSRVVIRMVIHSCH